MAKPAPDIENIFSQAERLLNEEGEIGLSMRNLASRVGCSPVSLYKHIGKRDDLLDGIISRFFKSIDFEIPSEGGWQSKVLHWARQIRIAYLMSPGVVLILRPNTRWTVEATISKQLYQIFKSAGFGESQSTSLCRTFMWQVTALSAMEVLSLSTTEAPLKKPFKPLSNETFHEQLAVRHTLEMACEIFDYSVALMVDGVDREKRAGLLPAVLRK